MKKIKQAVAVLLVAVMGLSFTACSDTSWITKVNGEDELGAGIYLAYLVSAYNQALSDTSTTADTIWDETIDEKDAETWIKEKAIEMMENHIAANILFEELGMTLNSADLTSISNSLSSLMESYGDMYYENGAGEASLKEVLTTSYKSDMIFEHYYGEGGVDEVADEDIRAYFYENNALVQYVSRAKSQADGTPLDDETLDANKEALDEITTRLNSGEPFDDIMDEEYIAMLESYGMDPEEYGPDTTNPNRNKTLLKKNADSAMAKAAFENSSYNVPFRTEDDDYYYVIVRLDLADEDNASYYDNNKKDILYTMMEPDYTEILQGALEGYDISFNEDSLSRYSPRNVTLS